MASQSASGHEFIEKNMTWLVVLVITLIGVIYYLAVGRRKQFAPVIAPAGDDEPLVTGAAQPEA